MEQQIRKVRELLNKLPKAVLIEMLLSQETETETPIPTISEPTLFDVNAQRYKRTPSRATTSRRRWTQAQDESLIYAVRQGRKTYEEIGQLLGRTNKAVCQRAVILRSRGDL